jgi:hypothetical protein
MTHGHANIKELKTKFKADFDKVQNFVNALDPCGLISGGAPDDEYDCLTSHLLSGLYENKSRQDFKEIILHEIEHHFGTPDISTLTEPYKTEFYKDLEALLDKLDNIKPSH